MPVEVEFLNGYPARMIYANPMMALRDIRTRTLRVQSLSIDEQSIDVVLAHGGSGLLDEVRPFVERLKISVGVPFQQPQQCPLFVIIPDDFPRLVSLVIDGFLPFNMDSGFGNLERLELRASWPLTPCVNLQALSMAMATWNSLTELSLHHCMCAFTNDLLPGGLAFPVPLPPKLKSLVVEDSPDQVYSLLTHLVLSPDVRSHFIAVCPAFPVDVGPLFQMLTPTPYVEFFAAPQRVNLPILGQVCDVVVDYSDNLKVTGTTKAGDTIVLEIRAPPPSPFGSASKPALLSSTLKRLSELFIHELAPENQLVQTLVVTGDISQVGADDWLRLLGRYNLTHLCITDRAMGSSRPITEALCPQGDTGDCVCRDLVTLELAGFPHGDEDDFDTLLHTLHMRSENHCDLANLVIRYLWEPRSSTAVSLMVATNNIKEAVREAAPNMAELQVELSTQGLRLFGGGYI